MLDSNEKEKESEEILEEANKNVKLLYYDENKSILVDVTPNFTCKWLKCAKEIDEEVKLIAETEKSGHVSAYGFPDLADKLVKDNRFFALWSCIDRDIFGYGRIPACSAVCESEFKHIKTLNMKR